MVSNRYGLEGGSWIPSHEFGSLIWKDILNIVADNQNLLEFYKGNFKILVGNGKGINL